MKFLTIILAVLMASPISAGGYRGRGGYRGGGYGGGCYSGGSYSSGYSSRCYSPTVYATPTYVSKPVVTQVVKHVAAPVVHKRTNQDLLAALAAKIDDNRSFTEGLQALGFNGLPQQPYQPPYQYQNNSGNVSYIPQVPYQQGTTAYSISQSVDVFGKDAFAALAGLIDGQQRLAGQLADGSSRTAIGVQGQLNSLGEYLAAHQQYNDKSRETHAMARVAEVMGVAMIQAMQAAKPEPQLRIQNGSGSFFPGQQPPQQPQPQAGQPQLPEVASVDQLIGIKSACINCHSGDSPKGGIVIDGTRALDTTPDANGVSPYQKALAAVLKGTMPPPDSGIQLTIEQKAIVLADLCTLRGGN